MFVASLNLDLFFKKVFSNQQVAKRFLEDLLGVKIMEIKLLSVENKITDAAVTVKFDFRCKINGQYVVIEMQQKYKVDVVKRFYLYQAVSTALQLETLKSIKVVNPNGKIYTEKNYSGLEPVITLVWMVDDMLGFDADFIAFTTLPEAAKDFILDDALWQQPLEKILAERKKTIDILENKTKGLDFFTQNRMIYVFQKNIVKNQRVDLPYFKWFDVANISRNPDNKEEDFSKYKSDKDMAEVIDRIRKDKLAPDEFKYVSDLYNYDLYAARLEEDYDGKIAQQEALQRKRLAKLKERERKIVAQMEERERKIVAQMTDEKQKVADEKQKVADEKQKVADEKQKVADEKQKSELFQMRLLKSIKILLSQGETIASIAEALDISVTETTELVARITND